MPLREPEMAETASSGALWRLLTGTTTTYCQPGSATELACFQVWDFRGVGGYVVGPPSLHPSGARYRWIIHDGLGRAPSWLVDLLRPERERAINSPQELRVGTAYGQAVLRRELERLSQAQDGTRNHSLNVAAFKLGRLVAAGQSRRLRPLRLSSLQARIWVIAEALGYHA
jgi:Bifunctional DNA primase/polymerase, N-terminal